MPPSQTPGARGEATPEKIVLTDVQLGLARHALGLPNGQRRTYRNRFVTGPGPGSTDHAEWMVMVERGAAGRRCGQTLPFSGDDMFWLTRAGAQAALKRGERLCPEDFPAPEATP